MVMDDDLIPRDDTILEDAVLYLSKLKDKCTILGPFGLQLHPNEPYCKGRHVNVRGFHNSFFHVSAMSLVSLTHTVQENHSKVSARMRTRL